MWPAFLMPFPISFPIRSISFPLPEAPTPSEPTWTSPALTYMSDKIDRKLKNIKNMTEKLANFILEKISNSLAKNVDDFNSYDSTITKTLLLVQRVSAKSLNTLSTFMISNLTYGLNLER